MQALSHAHTINTRMLVLILKDLRKQKQAQAFSDSASKARAWAALRALPLLTRRGVVTSDTQRKRLCALIRGTADALAQLHPGIRLPRWPGSGAVHVGLCFQKQIWTSKLSWTVCFDKLQLNSSANSV